MHSIVIGAVALDVDPILAQLAKTLDASGIDVSNYRALLTEAQAQSVKAQLLASQGDMRGALEASNKAVQIRTLAMAVAKADQTAIKSTSTTVVQTVKVDPVPGVTLAPTAKNNIVLPGVTTPGDFRRVTKPAAPLPPPAPAPEGEPKPFPVAVVAGVAVLGVVAFLAMRKKA